MTATARPKLLVYPPVGDMPAMSILDLPTCPEHQKTVTLADLIDDDGWEKIVDGFVSVGRIAPLRKRTKLEWELIDPLN